jgi:hypothetical protein
MRAMGPYKKERKKQDERESMRFNVSKIKSKN